MITVCGATFLEAATQIAVSEQSSICNDKVFRSFFGVSPSTCAIIWKEANGFIRIQCQPVHLLWTLLFCKQYTIEVVAARLTSCDAKTYRTKVWEVLTELSYVHIVSSNDASVVQQAVEN